MRFLPTRIHALLDYVVGTILLILPWVLNFSDVRAATYVVLILGAAAVVYSLCTAYEGGAAKLLSMRAHLTLDFLSGVFLALSPWLLGFSDRVYLPHLVLGVFEIVASLVTQAVPQTALPQQGSKGRGVRR